MDRAKVAVTGAAGQIGSVLVKRMSEMAFVDTVAVCRNVMSAGVVRSRAPGCEIRVGSITENDSCSKLLGDCDVIINCALAMVSGKPRRSRFLNRSMIDNFSRLDRLKALVHLSSISVYGEFIYSENSSAESFRHPKPEGDYGRSKLCVEQYAKERMSSKGLHHYVLRLGHVYGGGMDRSREVLRMARDPRFLLPFNGELPSNTVHVEHLASMLIALLSKPLPGGVYNVADKDRSWRQVFDWHTEAVGLPAAKGMGTELSEDLRKVSCARSISNDIGRWLKGLPVVGLLRYPAVFENAYRLLSIAPESLTSRLAVMYKKREVRGQIKGIGGKHEGLISPVYFSEAMPGVYLNVSTDARISQPTEEELSFRLREWYERYSNPTWLPKQIHFFFM